MTKRIPDEELKAIVRMLANSYSFREIQNAIKVSLGMLSKIKRTTDNIGMSLEELVELSSTHLSILIYGSWGRKVEPDWQRISELLKGRPKYTLKKCHEEYVKTNEEESVYSYSRFCSLYKQWIKRRNVLQ